MEPEYPLDCLEHAHIKNPKKYADVDVVESFSGTLQIDLDDLDAKSDFLRRYERFKASFGLGELTLKPSKTKGHYHGYIQLNSLVTELERIALQAILGSDYKREAMNYLRVMANISPAIIFYEPKGN